MINRYTFIGTFFGSIMVMGVSSILAAFAAESSIVFFIFGALSMWVAHRGMVWSAEKELDIMDDEW